MLVQVIKKAYYNDRRVMEGEVIDYVETDDEDKLPSWAIPEGAEAPKPKQMRMPGKQPRTMHEMTGQQTSVKAKANTQAKGSTRRPATAEKPAIAAPESKVTSTKGNTADAKGDGKDDILG